MDADACGWVIWGTISMGGHKKQVKKRKKNDRAGYIFVPMVREISPNIMLCDGRRKVTQMGVDGYKWVRMGGAWCRYTEGTKKTEKEGWMVDQDMFCKGDRENKNSM